MNDFFEKYETRIHPEPNSGCWLWIGSASTAGYGTITRWNRSHLAHRCAYEAANGLGSAKGAVIRHRCDNPACVNPDHLLSGTARDNAQDAVERGRLRPVHGERSGRSVLTLDEVAEMRRLASGGAHVCDIARRFNRSHKITHAAVTGASWKHYPGAVRSPARKATIPPKSAPFRKLNAEKVALIRSSEGFISGRKLARDLGVTNTTIYAIWKGKLHHAC